MGSTISREYESKTGQKITVRAARPEDAASILAITSQVIADGDFSVTEPDELQLDLADEEAWISSHAFQPEHIVLVAEISKLVVGVANFEQKARRRLAHTGMAGLSVRDGWRSQGVGTALLQALLEWAAGTPHLEKVGLAVLSTNARAIGLYRKLGFVEEGRRPKAVKLGPGRYADEVLMYKFVKPAPEDPGASL